MTRKAVISSTVASILTAVSLLAPVAGAAPQKSVELPDLFTTSPLSSPLSGWESLSDLNPLSGLDSPSAESSTSKLPIPSMSDIIEGAEAVDLTQQLPSLGTLVQPSGDVTSELKAIVGSIRKEYGGTVAVSISNGTHIYTAGDDAMLRTWSTIKVPLAIAALRENPKLQAQARLSITASDNQATNVLWNSLGAGSQAANAVSEVIREAGASAQVSTAAWGASSMKPSQQAKFGARLRCLPRASKVRSLMGQIIPEQSYGLGRISNAIFKGGWGPSDNGYVVRQFGSVSLPGGTVGVALYVEPSSGSYALAQEAANEIADRLEPLTTRVGFSVC